MNNPTQLNHPLTVKLSLVVLVGVLSAVACGASSKSNHPRKTNQAGNVQTPLKPVTYDPRLSLAPLVEKVSDAVVNIKTTQKVSMGGPQMGRGNLFEYFFGPMNPRQFQQQLPDQIRNAMGSGFIISTDGLVVTNRHVIADADEIEITLSDESTYQAKVVGADEQTDVALLKIEPRQKLPTVHFGDSDKLKVGDHVVAIGNPFGLDHTVTSGIVSAKERVIGAGPYDNFIQTDASINPGNSGGPLFNLEGEVVGINTAISRDGQGIGFAIPASLAQNLINALKETGKVVRGWLGIGFQPLNEDLAKALSAPNTKGALVTQVNPNSPAAAGGLEPRDIIVSVGGTPLHAARDLPTLVASQKPGKNCRISIIRDGAKKRLSIKIGTMPDGGVPLSEDNHQLDKGHLKLGLEISPLTDELRRKLGAGALQGGVVVMNIAPDSPLRGLIRQGDVIVEYNQQPVGTTSDLQNALHNSRKGKKDLIKVFRRGGYRYLVISH